MARNMLENIKDKIEYIENNNFFPRIIKKVTTSEKNWEKNKNYESKKLLLNNLKELKILEIQYEGYKELLQISEETKDRIKNLENAIQQELQENCSDINISELINL